MKTNLLWAALLCVAGMNAQTNHIIDWYMGALEEDTHITVDAGDTVTWVWTDDMDHSVTSMEGSTETFDSGVQNVANGGGTFSHTFTQSGENPYGDILISWLTGNIIVEGSTAAVKEPSRVSITFYPNPVSDILTLSAPDIIDSIVVYDAAGKQVLNAHGGTQVVKLYIASYPAGTYHISTSCGSKITTEMFIKK
jgi:hypothetical protein